MPAACAGIGGATPVPSITMCGIVGYVGERGARLDVVLRASAGWSTGGTTPRASRVVDDDATAGVAVDASGPGSSPASSRPSTPSRCRRGDRHRPHPLGHPRRPHRRQRPPPHQRGRPPRRDPQRDHRELRGTAAPSCSSRAWPSPARPTPRSSRTCSAARATPRTPRGPRPPRCAAVCGARSRAPSPCSRCTPTRPAPSSAPAATPRSSSGLGDGANYLGSDVAAFIGRTRAALELGQDQVVTITADAVVVTDFDGAPGHPAAFHVDWDAAAAEKGGYAWFMDKEIHEQPKAVADTLLGRTDAARRASCSTSCRIDDRGAAPHRQDRRHRVRHRRLRGPGREVRHRALVPHPGRGRARPRVPLPRPGRHRAHARRRHLAVRRDDGHGDGRAPRPRAGREGAGHLQHPRLDHPARVRRGALHPRRPRGRRRLDQGVPRPDHRLLPARASTSRSCAATCSPTRCAEVLGQLHEMPHAGPDGARPGSTQVRELARELADTTLGAVPRPPRRVTRWPWRAR